MVLDKSRMNLVYNQSQHRLSLSLASKQSKQLTLPFQWSVARADLKVAWTSGRSSSSSWQRKRVNWKKRRICYRWRGVERIPMLQTRLSNLEPSTMLHQLPMQLLPTLTCLQLSILTLLQPDSCNIKFQIQFMTIAKASKLLLITLTLEAMYLF